MMEKLPSMMHLMRHLQQVPYLASKNLYRVTDYFLSSDERKIQQFCQALLDAKKNITLCSICCAWKETTQGCMFCNSPQRTQETICVVETWQELISIERTGGYHGMYHVLGGVISPLDGVNPEDLTIAQLINRVKQTPCEIIFATNQTPEGENTALYIANKLKDFSITISCLARGIPVGSSLEYMDKLTLYKALSERRPF